LHGDWTLIGRFRRALAHRVRFVEITYPRTLTWSLEEYAAGIETALAEQGISSGWLLGESYGSQVLWPLVAGRRFSVEGVILAGGFVRHPMRWGVRCAERICRGLPLRWLVGILFGYAWVARVRHSRDPEIEAAMREFIARRTELDKRAAQHRLRLIAHSDFRTAAAQVRVPVYALAGFFDPIVPWGPVRRWLGRNCVNLRAYQVVPCDHNVLSNAAARAAASVLEWMAKRHAPGS
jgi:pimeloyl-ACP methyl ester carboxylesterase